MEVDILTYHILLKKYTIISYYITGTNSRYTPIRVAGSNTKTKKYKLQKHTNNQRTIITLTKQKS